MLSTSEPRVCLQRKLAHRPSRRTRCIGWSMTCSGTCATRGMTLEPPRSSARRLPLIATYPQVKCVSAPLPTNFVACVLTEMGCGRKPEGGDLEEVLKTVKSQRLPMLGAKSGEDGA